MEAIQYTYTHIPLILGFKNQHISYRHTLQNHLHNQFTRCTKTIIYLRILQQRNLILYKIFLLVSFFSIIHHFLTVH